jgi:hypothetical protein
MTLGLSWFRPGPYVQQLCSRGTVLLRTMVLIEGRLQAWWERRPGLRVPEVLIEASANIVEKAKSVWLIAIRRPMSPRLGDCPSFYRPRRVKFTCVLHYFPTCGGMAGSAMELTTVLANPAPVEASWCVLCSYRSGFEGRSAAVGRPASVVGRFEGAINGGSVRGTVAVAATAHPRVPQQRRDVITVPGVVQQWRGWSQKVDSDGDDRSRQPDVMAWPCVSTEKTFEGAATPFRGLGVLAYGGRRHSVTELTPALPHSAT